MDPALGKSFFIVGRAPGYVAHAYEQVTRERPFKAAAQAVDPELARRGEGIHKQLCEKCHTDNGAHPVEDAAILAGQWTPYLRRQFANVLSGKREVPQVMLRRIEALKEQHVEALLNFYAETGLQRAQQ